MVKKEFGATICCGWISKDGLQESCGFRGLVELKIGSFLLTFVKSMIIELLLVLHFATLEGRIDVFLRVFVIWSMKITDRFLSETNQFLPKIFAW